MWTITTLFGSLGLALAMVVSDVSAAKAELTRSSCVNGGGKWICKNPDNPYTCYCFTPGKPKPKEERPPR
jgi:hypothetical protein